LTFSTRPLALVFFLAIFFSIIPSLTQVAECLLELFVVICDDFLSLGIPLYYFSGIISTLAIFLPDIFFQLPGGFYRLPRKQFFFSFECGADALSDADLISLPSRFVVFF